MYLVCALGISAETFTKDKNRGDQLLKCMYTHVKLWVMIQHYKEDTGILQDTGILD